MDAGAGSFDEDTTLVPVRDRSTVRSARRAANRAFDHQEHDSAPHESVHVIQLPRDDADNHKEIDDEDADYYGESDFDTILGRATGSPPGAHRAVDESLSADAQFGVTPLGAAHFGSAQHGSAQYGSAQYGPAQYGAPHYGTSQYGPAQYGAPHYGTSQYGAAPYGTTHYGPAQNSQTQYSAAQHAAALYGVHQPADDQLTGNHVTADHVAGDHVARDHFTEGHVTGDQVIGERKRRRPRDAR
jgi:hypothetical protein